jgi:GntR family transcriptional regulator/MocR family aminotransferase
LIAITQFIRLDRRKSDPLYLQIAYQFINAVHTGLILEGVKLPGTRVWSEELGVHRKTVIAAFEELEAQNWIRIKPRVGAFVQNPSLKVNKNGIFVEKSATSTQKAQFQFNRSYIISSPFEKGKSEIVCNDGQPDYRIIKTQELSRFYTGALKRRNIESIIGNYAVQENEFFKEQLSTYLNFTRGFYISKNQLLITKSRGMLFYTLAKMLFLPGDVVLVGELSFFSMNMIFNQEKIKVETVPLDNNGIDISFIQKKYKKGDIRCVYLNPQQSYPTTAQLSPSRRADLIRLADELDFVIIEDNDDFEFSYEKQLDLPLAVNNARVIHLGSVGKCLHPTFQLSFMIAPPDFIMESKKHISVLNPQGDFVLEQALGEMIVEGDLLRYQKKTLKIFHERMLHFASLLKEHFGSDLIFNQPLNGFAYWIEFQNDISLTNLAHALKARDVFLPRICMFQDKKRTALRLGFAHWNIQEMETFMLLFKESFESVR